MGILQYPFFTKRGKTIKRYKKADYHTLGNITEAQNPNK